MNRENAGILGRWEGTYTFDDGRINVIRGHEHTRFEVRIDQLDGEQFSGAVEDDLSTGGTEGVGMIRGRWVGRTVEFVKQMPRMTILLDTTGRRKVMNRKHRPIYYSGEISEDGSTISGTWHFRRGVVWIGLLPTLMHPSTGTWEMRRGVIPRS